ncbi:MAG: NADH-quinone oxidoreductase subunit N [Rhizobiales bacterium]|nr:NADH-quinone oxidoreductase subunit N [Hyphomicrobiales bacterium]|tara:strand:- start:53 stop:1543 length:1491 start_codon:yes stop_codon:yes gene_type:complete
MTNLQSLEFFIPELILTITILAALITDLFVKKSKTNMIGWVLGVGLVVVGLSVHNLSSVPPTTLFLDMIVIDPFSSFMKIVIILSTLLVIVASWVNDELEKYRKGEYFTIMGIMVMGLFLMTSSVDIIMLYISIEVVSIMSFVLAAYLKLDTRSNEAGLKYVIYGAFSSGVMLFGLSIVYGLAGSTNYFAIQDTLSSLDGSANSALIMALLMIFAGFGYKISSVPFHFWTPDVYEGSPSTITAYLSVAPKAAGFAMIIRFFHQVFSDSIGLTSNAIGSTDLPWPEIIGVLAVVTMTMGNLVAIQQKSIKRMLAYSSIAHAGYMMLALPVLSMEAVESVMIYLFIYVFMNLGAFFIVIFVKNKTGGESFEDFEGLGWKMPIVGAFMTLFMLSLTGLPPTAGFVGKLYIFKTLVGAGSEFLWLVVAGGVNSVISLYYYFHVVKVMFLGGKRSDVITYPPSTMFGLMIFTAVPSLLLGLYWNPLASWVKDSLVFYTQVM